MIRIHAEVLTKIVGNIIWDQGRGISKLEGLEVCEQAELSTFQTSTVFACNAPLN